MIFRVMPPAKRKIEVECTDAELRELRVALAAYMVLPESRGVGIKDILYNLTIFMEQQNISSPSF